MPRAHFVDRLKVVLTSLVIAHHTAITYGGSGSWFYREITDETRLTSQLLTLFCAVNQAFFMGMFFLLAGYFTPASLQQKGIRRFVVDRVQRLCFPMIAFGFILGPLTVALGEVPKGRPVLETWAAMTRSGHFVLGPLWFSWALLLFAGIWLLWAGVSPRCRWLKNEADQNHQPGWLAWLLSATGVGVTALVLRQWFPVGKEVLGLQLGYFASYSFLFFLGCHAASGRRLEQVGDSQARGWGLVSLLVVPVLPVSAVLFKASKGTWGDFSGGLSTASVIYAFWEPLVAWGIIAVLLAEFRKLFNVPDLRWKRWSAEAYGAFVVHSPIVVGLSVAMSQWPAPPLAKFSAVAVAGTVLSFLLSRVLRGLPGIARVL